CLASLGSCHYFISWPSRFLLWAVSAFSVAVCVLFCIGSPQRLEFTAIGNTVNIASRVQGLTKSIGRPLLVTAAVRDQSRDCCTFEELPPQEIRGIERRVMIFALTA